MSILAISFVGVTTAVLSLSLRRYNAEISIAVAVVGSIIIFLSVILNLSSVYETVSSILRASSVNSAYIAILLKSVGICFLTEFASDCCFDAGQRALANNIAIAGKVLVLVTAMPLYKDVLDTVLSLTGNSV
ncbi:MAG: stage III sporulation AC/AD family protein [Ruminococcus sp.]|nr:stage III sporulation AC/AD family protein [Ruminococcus sp.]